MGTYYLAANRTKKEFLDPFHVGNGGIKYYSVAYGSFALLLGKMMASAWLGDEVVILSDNIDEYHDIEKSFKDVTRDEVANFNDDRPPWCEKISYKERE